MSKTEGTVARTEPLRTHEVTLDYKSLLYNREKKLVGIHIWGT